MLMRKMLQIGVQPQQSKLILPSCKLQRNYASEGGFFKDTWSKIIGKSSEQSNELAVEGAKKNPDYVVMEDYELLHEEEIKQRLERVEKERLKSRLFHSDRALILNQKPNAGLDWEKNDDHRSHEFKAAMFARFGESTGVDPSIVWPTKEEIDTQGEYEHVLYDGKSLAEMIDAVERQIKEDEQKIIDKEKEIADKLAKQDDEVRAWQKRVEAKNVAAQREKLKREAILAELKEEFGYDINPNNPQLRSKIEEKEKEWAQRQKDAKKKKAEEFKAAKAEEAQKAATAEQETSSS